MKACPYCAEQIQDGAVVCRFCGRDLPEGVSETGATPDRSATKGPGLAEQRLWAGRPALLSQPGKVSAGALLLAAGVVVAAALPELRWAGIAGGVVGLALLAVAWLGILRYRYEVTDQRAISREGLFSQSTSEIQLEDVRNIIVHKTFGGRLLGVGTVELSTSGESGMEVIFLSVRNPDAIVRLVNDHNP